MKQEIAWRRYRMTRPRLYFPERMQLGRPRISPETEERIRKALAAPGRPGVREIAKRFGVAPNTVMRINRPFASVA